ncbi:MAG: hypothetical protein GXP19_01080 [Gammaproteobacteria bacterium]|nr:hypothetical protein [Gammaproteobacteria bacterium]
MTKTYQKTDGTTVTITEEHYKKAREMTEEEVHQGALDDPDAQPLTEEELKQFKPVNPNLRKKK